jgi:hypothetical protein
MEKKLFRSWRKERLLKMKEQKEASKREAEHDIIFSTPVQSEDGDVALKTSSKPRTVSFEEGENDAASRSIFIHVAMRQDIFSWKRNNKHEDELDINVPHGVGYVQAAQWYVHATRKINQGNNMMPCDEEPDTFGIKWCIDLGDRNKITSDSLFLFLPRKEKVSHRDRIWRLLRDLLSLKDLGWGPPDTAKSMHEKGRTK